MVETNIVLTVTTTTASNIFYFISSVFQLIIIPSSQYLVIACIYTPSISYQNGWSMEIHFFCIFLHVQATEYFNRHFCSKVLKIYTWFCKNVHHLFDSMTVLWYNSYKSEEIWNISLNFFWFIYVWSVIIDVYRYKPWWLCYRQRLGM